MHGSFGLSHWGQFVGTVGVFPQGPVLWSLVHSRHLVRTCCELSCSWLCMWTERWLTTQSCSRGAAGAAALGQGLGRAAAPAGVLSLCTDSTLESGPIHVWRRQSELPQRRRWHGIISPNPKILKSQGNFRVCFRGKECWCQAACKHGAVGTMQRRFIKVQSGLHDSVDKYDVTRTYPISNPCCHLCVSGFVSSLSRLVSYWTASFL